MKRLIVILILLIASVSFGIFIIHHPSYLFIVFDEWTLQTSLWFAILITFLFLAILYYLVTSVDQIQFLWYRLKNWWQYRKAHRAYNKTRHGLTLLFEGQLKKAEKLLLAGSTQETELFINYVGIAKIAESQGDLKKANRFLEKAHQIFPDSTIAVEILRAKWELKHNNIEEARVILTRLVNLAPNHPEVLKLLERLYVATSDWERLDALIPKLTKAKILTRENASLLTQHVAIEALKGRDIHSAADLRAKWQSLPRTVSGNPLVTAQFIKRLIEFGEINSAEELIRQVLKYHYHDELVLLYGTLPFAILKKQYVIVGAWLKHYGAKPEIYLTLARLCKRDQLWGKAKDYFEKCLSLGNNIEASLELGNLYEQLGEPELARETYEKALKALTYHS